MRIVDVSDPDHIWMLEEKLKQAGIFTMTEVTHFAEVFYVASDFARIVFDLLVAQIKAGQLDKRPPSSQPR